MVRTIDSHSAVAAPSLVADAQEAPLAPNSTPPLAIYVRRCAFFLF